MFSDDAPDAGALIKALQEQTDNVEALAKALSHRAVNGEAASLEALRRQAFRPASQAVLTPLAFADPTWFVAHATDIIVQTPQYGPAVLREIIRHNADLFQAVQSLSTRIPRAELEKVLRETDLPNCDALLNSIPPC